MEFSPEHLMHHMRLVPPGGPLELRYYSRDALEDAVPQEDRAGYMAAADKWVDENEGHHFYPSSDETYYALPQGKVRHRRSARA